MGITLVIISCLLWALAIWLLFSRQALAPVASFLALATLAAARTPEGYPMLPLNSTMLIGWLCMTLVVAAATLLQPAPIRVQNRGMGYMTVGAIVGMVVGLLGSGVSTTPAVLYSITIAAIACGVFLGYLLFTRTPGGVAVAPGSGNFFRYLLAKGFPTAITVMQAGVALTLFIAVSHLG